MRTVVFAGVTIAFLGAAVAQATNVGVVPTKLIVVDKTVAASKAKTVYVAKDGAITKGPGENVAQIDVEFDVAYGNEATAGGFVLPAGILNGWLVNKSSVAKYVNKTAPAGPTQAKVAVIKPGKLFKLVGKGLGDDPIDVFGAGDPNPGSVFTAACVNNGAQRFCHCSEFTGCAYKAIAAGTGAKLVCKAGVADPICVASPVPTTSTTTTSTTTTVLVTTTTSTSITTTTSTSVTTTTSTTVVTTTSTSTSTSSTTSTSLPPPVCGDGNWEMSEVCDDGNVCEYDGCTIDFGGGGQCVAEQSVVIVAMQLAGSGSGFNLDGVGGVDNKLGGNALINGQLNPLLSDAINDGTLTQVMTLGDLDNVPFGGTGTPGYSNDPDVLLSLYDGVGPNCENTATVPWVSGPWPADLYSNADTWDLGTCMGPFAVSDVDDPANGIYPTGGGQSASPAPAPPYLRMRTPVIEVPFAGTQLAFTNARIEATVQNNGVEVTGLSSGMLGGVVPPAVLWAVPGTGSTCPTGLHAVLGLIGQADQNVAGPGLDSLNASIGFLPCVFGSVSINS
jgi:cysteine-rich repeat protein